MNLDPMAMPTSDRYKLTTATILPRPIAWVSTRDMEGNLNLAPYSFFTVASVSPLNLVFSPQPPGPNEEKDTLRNIRAVQEFVINLTDESTAAAMNKTAVASPPGQSEFELAGLTPAASQTISVPRVAEAPVAFECKLTQIVDVDPQHPRGGSVVFGNVTGIYVRDDIYDGRYVDLAKLQPIGRLTGNLYAHISDTFELIRE